MQHTLRLLEQAISSPSPLVAEALDASAFGDLRSLLASPYPEVKRGRTFLRAVAEMVSKLLEAHKNDPGAQDTILTYAGDILSKITKQELLVLQTKDVNAVLAQGQARAQRLEPNAVELMRVHQLAIVSGSAEPLDVGKNLNVLEFLKLKVGSVKPYDGRFSLLIPAEDLVDYADDAGAVIAQVAKGHNAIDLEVEGESYISGIPAQIKQLAGITPSSATLTARFKVTNWTQTRARYGFDPLPFLLSRMAAPSARVRNTGGRLKVILAFTLGYMVDGDDVEEMQDAAGAGIIQSGEPGDMQNEVILTLN